MSCSTGKFRRRVIIPSFNLEGNLNYYVARTIDDAKKMKYRNAEVPKEEVIFNAVDLDWEKEIILVEGVFDAMKCPENTVPVLGSTLSKKSNLLKMVTRHQTPCLVSLDPDMKQKAYKLADLLVSSGCPVRISFAPSGMDLGELSKSEVSDLISIIFASFGRYAPCKKLIKFEKYLQNTKSWKVDGLYSINTLSRKILDCMQEYIL